MTLYVNLRSPPGIYPWTSPVQTVCFPLGLGQIMATMLKVDKTQIYLAQLSSDYSPMDSISDTNCEVMMQTDHTALFYFKLVAYFPTM